MHTIMTIPCTYFGNVQWLWLLIQGAEIEAHENFPKQTLRNRTELMSDKGRQKLTVPITAQHGLKIPIQNVLIDNSTNWNIIHLRAIQSYYAYAPYFEHYFPLIEKLLNTQHTHLFDLCNQTNQLIVKALKLNTEVKFTQEFNPTKINSFGKSGLTKDNTNFKPMEYYQVFSEKLPFEPNLSMLDYLFCVGPEDLVNFVANHRGIINAPIIK